MKRVKCILALVLTSLMLGACGASVTLPPANAQPSLGGIWKGQLMVPSGATLPALVLVTEDGRFFSVAQNVSNDCADVAQGSLLLTGGDYSGTGDFGIISATGDIGAQVDCAFSDGSVWGTGVLSGSLVPGSTLSWTADDTTSMGTALATSGTLSFDDVYNEASSLSKLAGKWTVSTGALLTIDADGTILSQDAASGCEVNGKVSLINGKYNAYAVTATYSNCGANGSALNGLSGTGLMTLDDTQNPSVLYVGYSMTLAGGEVLLVASNATGGG